MICTTLNRLKTRKFVIEYFRKQGKTSIADIIDEANVFATAAPHSYILLYHLDEDKNKDIWAKAAIGLHFAYGYSLDKYEMTLSAEPVYTRKQVDAIRHKYDELVSRINMDTETFKLLQADPYDYEYMSRCNEYFEQMIAAVRLQSQASFERCRDELLYIKKHFHIDNPYHPLDEAMYGVRKMSVHYPITELKVDSLDVYSDHSRIHMSFTAVVSGDILVKVVDSYNNHYIVKNKIIKPYHDNFAWMHTITQNYIDDYANDRPLKTVE